MNSLATDAEAPSDAALISRVRDGDTAAYGDLFERHAPAATRLARQLVRGPDADDLVAEAFAKVLPVLQGGGGPDVAFRAYLLTAVRRLHVDRIRVTARLHTTDDLTPFDPGVPFTDPTVAAFESAAAARAFTSLPERWQLVLWHLEVEGQKPAEVAPLLGLTANSVSALAYRAREGLRQAFLQMHLDDLAGEGCRWAHDHLGAHVRGGLSRRDGAKVEAHLAECRGCAALSLELAEVNSGLRGLLAPVVLGSAAAGYLTSVGGGTAGTGLGLLAGLVGRARDVVLAHAQAGVTAGVAGGVAAAVTLGVVTLPGEVGAPSVPDRPAAVGTPAAGTADAEPRRTPRRRPSESARVRGPARRSPAPVTAPSSVPAPVPPAGSAPAPVVEVPELPELPELPAVPEVLDLAALPEAPELGVTAEVARRSVDLTLSSSSTTLLGGPVAVSASMLSLAAEAEGTLRFVASSSLTVRSGPQGCERVSTQEFTCPVTLLALAKTMVVDRPQQAHGAGTVTVSVEGPEGTPDPEPGDNQKTYVIDSR